MPNRLAGEKSPYLLQHAENPVDWYPWNEDAFAKARAEQKPIFLSIGYSTCHWCHVMAHESFENDAVAKLLNEHFVSIKVDREERPDVDRVYMTYVQAMTGHGGWPLSAWLTPELKPFYGGTYYPPEDRPGRPGFATLLQAIARGWVNDREKLTAESDRVIEALRAHADGKASPQSPEPAAGEAAPSAGAADVARFFAWTTEAFEKGFQFYYESFNPAQGGFGGAPKFPRASNLHFLFRVAATQGVESEVGKEAVQMAATTLRKMAEGGIHDHIGGGFHRYSVDEQWFVPHFEKMLYDQAQIALNCLEARQATGDERFAWLARHVFGYVQRDLAHPGGGFYSAEDADSKIPGESGEAKQAEGAFYVWRREEIERVLPADEAELFCMHFDVKPDGNVPAALDPHEEFRGKNILRQVRPLAETAQAHGLTPEQASDRLWSVLQRLRDVRAARSRPHLDDKIITAWNGLMISAFARGAQLLEGPAPEGALLQTATRAAEFLQRELYDAERGVIFRSYRAGRSAIEGFASDYAFLIQGLLDLYEAGFELRWLQWAERLQQTMDERFWDESHGGYFDSAAGDASIVLRLKEDYDGAEPTPSSVAAANLFRFAALFDSGAAPRPGGMSYRERGLRTLEAFRARWLATPHGLPQMLCALEFAVEAPRHVVIAGDPAAADFRALTAVLHERLGRRRALLRAPGDSAAESDARQWLLQRAPWVADMRLREDRAMAYVCEEFACQSPVTEPEELRALLT